MTNYFHIFFGSYTLYTIQHRTVHCPTHLWLMDLKMIEDLIGVVAHQSRYTQMIYVLSPLVLLQTAMKAPLECDLYR